MKYGRVSVTQMESAFLAEDKTDHSIVRGPMTVIWAKGQESNTLSADPNTDRLFYELDVLRYHGGVNRGTLTLDFYGIVHVYSFLKDKNCLANRGIFPRREMPESAVCESSAKLSNFALKKALECQIS